MKRALAERAKQSGLPNGVGTAPGAVQEKSLPTPTPNTSSVPVSGSSSSINNDTFRITPVPRLQVPPSSQPPQKIPKVEIKPPITIGGSLKVTQSTRPTSASTSPRLKKRSRESSIKLEDEDEEDPNATSFYLKHQNRALASELRSVKYQLVRVERERDYRRTQCMQAVQSLNALHDMWEKVESAFEQQSHVGVFHKRMEVSNDVKSDTPAMTQLLIGDAPLSTGSGKSVEWIDALMNSLTRIGTTTLSELSVSKIKGNNIESNAKDEEFNNVVSNDDKMDVYEPVNNEDEDREKSAEESEGKKRVDDISKIASNVAERISLLQSWIWSLLQNLEKSTSLNRESSINETSWSPPSNMELENQVSKAEADNVTLQDQLKEMARSRDEMVESDRRVRRGLYRLAAGRMQLKEVLKAVANADEDKESAATWMEGSGAIISSCLPQKATSSSSLVLSPHAKKATENEKLENDGKTTTSLYEVEQLKKQVLDLDTLDSSRDEQIKKLLIEKEHQTKRINSLLLQEDKNSSDIPTNEEVKRSDLYLELTAKLATNTRKLEELNDKSNVVQKEWSDALANAEFSKQALEDMQTKFSKRWSELTEEKSDRNATHELGGGTSGIVRVENVITLQHKLTQALENVRHAETSRKTLDEAILMNNSLQAKVEEFKSKYNALQAEKIARASNSGSGSNSNHNSSNTTATSSSAAVGSSTPKAKSLSSSASTHSTEKVDRSIDKLHRDYKRARKELAATTASKDAAKAKLERIEKEKEFLSQMNSRLLKQASEKDEINAKSLSTILHLKQLTEQITKEKDNLEQQAKSAEQLALAARLASNARNRLAEEFANKQKQLQIQLDELEEKCAALANQKEFAEAKLSQEKARMSGFISDTQKAKKRCEELATEATKVQEERQQVIESLAIAKREASEATNLSKKLVESKGGGLVGGFTAEQLSTQVSHLKNRLSCPVCNVRDKKCILLRCRHMFCKQCVDETVRNRSRKCPACGGRFDTKDVADVWL